MIYQDAANRLAAEGRGGDTTLVHMSPGEVRGLQALAMAHGGSLSINPSTGLPEAGFLSSILPMIAGAALAPLTGGLINPMTAGLLIGGGTALATGDIKKGISAGLGAYGGAGLGAGLMNVGASTAEAAANALGVPGAVTGPGSQAAMLAAQNQGFGQAGLEALGQSAAGAAGATPAVASGTQSALAGLQGVTSSGAAGEAARSGFMSGVGGLGGLAKYGAAAAAPMLMGGMGQGQPPGISQTPTMNRLEYQARPTTPTPRPDVPGYDDLGRDFGREQRYYDGRYIDTGRKFVPGDFGPVTPMPMADGGQVNIQGTLNLSGMDGGQSGPRSANGYTPAGSGGGFDQRAIAADPQGFASFLERARAQEAAMPGSTFLGARPFGMADGGLAGTIGNNVSYPLSGVPSAQLQYGVQDPQQANVLRNTPVPEVDPYTGEPRFASGGISHLGDYSDGGRMLRGPGDGVSDSIPATIGGKQPARLADGEFVIPARIVSEIGNGSSEAGARKLYAMMDRIQNVRKKTVGKDKVAVNTKAEKLLPA